MCYQYIMVTGWNKHWDNIPDNRTYYTSTMLKGLRMGDVLHNNTPTVFVKISANNKLEKVWLGSVNEITEKEDKIYFNVKIDRELFGNDIKKYKGKQPGWYIEKRATTRNEDGLTQTSMLQPLFFEVLRSTQDWEEFENYTFYLIRLLGIHTAYKFAKNRQAGKADGFFKFQNLAVIYDCTLDEKFEQKKKDQITNYCNQLKMGSLEIPEGIFEEFHNYQKQVWIITRGKSRVIKKVDSIAVKEVSIDKIINLYENRLQEMVSAENLENLLRNLS